MKSGFLPLSNRFKKFIHSLANATDSLFLLGLLLLLSRFVRLRQRRRGLELHHSTETTIATPSLSGAFFILFTLSFLFRSLMKI